MTPRENPFLRWRKKGDAGSSPSAGPSRSDSSSTRSGKSSPMAMRRAQSSYSNLSIPPLDSGEFETERQIMTVERALREILQVNERIKGLEKLAETPAPTASIARQQEQERAQRAEELLLRLNAIFVVDGNERMQVQSLRERVLKQLSKFLKSEPNGLAGKNCISAMSSASSTSTASSY
eukprot:3199950-Rhodomonas_salina.1